MRSDLPTDRPRFAIMNTMDAPQRRMVCEWVPNVGYCYMMRHHEPHLKDFDGMNPPRPTSLEDFGFRVDVLSIEAVFTRIADSTATYEDGKPRSWQDRCWTDQFSLPLVKGRIKNRRRVLASEESHANR